MLSQFGIRQDAVGAGSATLLRLSRASMSTRSLAIYCFRGSLIITDAILGGDRCGADDAF